MPRVLMYAKYITPRYSGAGRQGLSLASALRRHGVEISFLTEATDERPEDYELDGFAVRTFFPATQSVSVQPSRSLALTRVLREHRREPVVFHAHSAYPEASAMGAAARVIGVPSILKVTLHRSDADCSGSRVIGRIHRQLLRRQSAIIAISSEIRAELRELGVSSDRIRQIPNGVDTERFRPADEARRRSARSALRLEPDRPVALFVGILNARKNVHWLLDRWEARSDRTAVTLVLAGPASEDPNDSIRQRVERMSADEGSGVQWIGVQERVEDVYAAADLLILPSEAEGMPNVVLEAMAAGVPSLVTDGSGIRDLMGTVEQTMLPIRFGDADAFDEAITLLTKELPGLRAVGAAARRRAEEVFSLDSVALRYRDLYEELITR
jgi:glycosyltransferase involved in cell wall biosynthesis